MVVSGYGQYGPQALTGRRGHRETATTHREFLLKEVPVRLRKVPAALIRSRSVLLAPGNRIRTWAEVHFGSASQFIDRLSLTVVYLPRASYNRWSSWRRFLSYVYRHSREEIGHVPILR